MEIVELYRTEIPEEIKTFLAMPPGIAKNKMYVKEGSRYMTEVRSIAREGSNIYYSITTYHIFKSSKSAYFLRQKTKRGLSYKDGVFRVWYGELIGNIPFLDHFFKTLKIDWLSPKLHEYLTKGLMERILSGRITNPQDFCKHWLKYNRIKCSHKAFYKFITENTIPRHTFLKNVRWVENVDHYLEWAQLKIHDNMLHDMWQQAEILERKINMRWSAKKMTDVHNKWSMELMADEIKGMEDVVLSYGQIPDLSHPELHIRLLKTKKDVFMEGTSMVHCLYTNYWRTIENKTYLAFHICYKGEEATLGVSYRLHIKMNNNTNETYLERECHWSQYYTRRNQHVSPEMLRITREWFETVKDGFILETSKELEDKMGYLGPKQQNQDEVIEVEEANEQNNWGW